MICRSLFEVLCYAHWLMKEFISGTNWILILVLFWLPYNSAELSEDETDGPVSYTIRSPDGFPVLAIETGFSAILIATSAHIYVYNLTSEALNDEYFRNLPRFAMHTGPLYQNIPANTGFMELKLLTDKTFIYCNHWACRYCQIRGDRSCKVTRNKVKGEAFSSVSIAYNYPKILMRVVDTTKLASTLLYNLENIPTSDGFLEAQQYIFDDPGISRQATVVAFDRGQFFYYVGSSAKAIDNNEDNISFLYQTSTNNIMVTITRIWALDNTTTVSSLMELTLDCRNDTTVPITLLSRAHYHLSKDDLWFTIHLANGEFQMCKYSMQEVNDKFDGLLDACNTAPLRKTQHECQNLSVNSNIDHCFVFARTSSTGPLESCSSLNLTASVNNRNYDNNNEYGWVEYFKPLRQNPAYSVLAYNDKVLQILPEHNYNNTIYTAFNPNNLFINVFWKNPSTQPKDDFQPILHIASSHGMSRAIAIFENNLCYISGSLVRIVPISCGSFYKSCESLWIGNWMSPKGCMWCTDEGNETSVHETDKTCKRSITGQCPARSKHGHEFSSTINIEGFKHLLPSTSKVNEKGVDWLMVSVLTGVVLMLAVLVGFIVREQKKAARRYISANKRPTRQYSQPLLDTTKYGDENLTSLISAFTSNSSKYDYANLFKNIDDIIKIDMSNLRLEETIGEGNFGIVLRGTYTTPDGDVRKVACKMLRDGEQGVRAFFDEGLTLMNFNHVRVIPFIGIALANDTDPIIVTKFMSNGNLLTYLQKNANTITVEQILDYSMQIAEGMEYLHSKKFIHRDLAARNCMLDYKMQIKIGDFGLARQCNDQNMYLSCNYPDLPFAWASIEALEFWTFTLKGDIWSYGVVLWELMSKGEKPFAKFTPSELLKFLKEGKRLDRPLDCPETFFASIMMPCWDENMNKRPSFSEIVEQLKDFSKSQFEKQLGQMHRAI